MLPPYLVTPLYAALCALLLLALSIRVAMLRRRLRVPIGSDGPPEILRAIRVQANCAEYVPLALLLLFLLELARQPLWALHLLGAMLLLGRLLHAIGLGANPGVSFGRFTGIALTWTMMGVAALWLLALVLQRLLLPA
jgi:uncharacterized membrane protein YecN with MAPEG domain